MPTAFFHRLRSFLCGACAIMGLAHRLPAQQIDLSLHATAVPDSFEVRATATSGTFTAVPNAVFTLRWDVAAGGVANNSDIRRACDGFTLLNYTGTIDFGDHRYFTLVLFGDRPLGPECAIGPEGRTIAGVRIRQLSGCHHVQLVQNAYTQLNNLDYYFSIGGEPVTGAITSEPIPGGACGPCAPPEIISATASAVPLCGIGPVDLAVTTTGGAMDYAWYLPGTTSPFHYLPNVNLSTSQPGPYLVVVRNTCGADSAWVTPPLDPALCVPPTIDSTWYSMEPTQNSPTTFYAMTQGNCLEPVQWIAPSGQSWQGHNLPGAASLDLTQPESGIYQVVAINDCGADTALINVDCKPRIISAHMSPPPPCMVGGPVQITSSVQGAYPMQSIWHTPNGGMFSCTNCSMGLVVAGSYVLVATNHCGSDSMTVILEFDTTGVGACVPPQILGITSNGPICDGDTVELQAEVIAGGPCLDIVWSGHSVVQSHSDHTIAPGGYGDYMVTVTNACGVASRSVESEVINYIPLDVAICDSISTPVGLFSLIWEITPGLQDGGTWTVDGAPHSPYFDTATDQAGTYSYQPPGLDCIAVDLHIVVNRSDLFAGVSDSITVCSSDPPFEMYPFLGGTPGGIWIYGFTYVSGIYDPATNYPGNFTYEVGALGDCWTQAVLTITEIGAQTWYADLDGDGHGDPDSAVEACDPPDGHVADASDNCPQVPGLVGDPCDDGNASTSGDVLSADCLCAGEYHVGIAENDDRRTVLWPNPLRQGTFRLDLPTWRGPVLITITDATGRVVMRQAYSATAAPLEVELPRAIAAATYWVNVLHAEGTTTQRLVVER